MTPKSLKLTMLGLVAVCVAGVYSALSFGQGATSPMAEPTTAQAPFGKKSGTWQKYRKEDVQAVMTKVAQDVWHAQYSGARLIIRPTIRVGPWSQSDYQTDDTSGTVVPD